MPQGTSGTFTFVDLIRMGLANIPIPVVINLAILVYVMTRMIRVKF
jgi:hypothetical protein